MKADTYVYSFMKHKRNPQTRGKYGHMYNVKHFNGVSLFSLKDGLLANLLLRNRATAIRATDSREGAVAVYEQESLDELIAI